MGAAEAVPHCGNVPRQQTNPNVLVNLPLIQLAIELHVRVGRGLGKCSGLLMWFPLFSLLFLSVYLQLKYSVHIPGIPIYAFPPPKSPQNETVGSPGDLACIISWTSVYRLVLRYPNAPNSVIQAKYIH